MLALLAAALVSAAPAVPSAADFRTAAARSKTADDAYREALLKLLKDGNPYARREAVKRFEALPDLVDGAVLDTVIGLLEDDIELYSAACVDAVERGRNSYAQGEMYEASRCEFSDAHQNSEVARRVLTRAMPSAALTAKLLDHALATRQPHVARIPEPVSEIFAASSAVMAAPFLERLKGPLDPVKRSLVLEYALFIHGEGFRSLDDTPLPRLLEDADVRTRCRAALVVLRLSPPDSALSKKAIAQVNLGLQLPDERDAVGGEAIAADVSLLGPGARPFADALTTRAKGSGYRGWTFEALAGIPEVAGAALPAAQARLACKAEGCVEDQVLKYLTALKENGRPASAALVAAAARKAASVEKVAATLEAIGAQPSPAEWQALRTAYGQDCQRAGSIAFYSFSRDERCDAAGTSLRALARRNGVTFREPKGMEE